MRTREVHLTEHHDGLIDRLVGSGRYENASEVLREGLRLVENREVQESARLLALRQAAAAGFDQFERGEFVEIDSPAVAELIASLGDRAARQDPVAT